MSSLYGAAVLLPKMMEEKEDKVVVILHEATLIMDNKTILRDVT